MFLRRVAAILFQRCPSCLHGRIFKGVFAMNRACGTCPNVFQREGGYFLGAMYFSYPLATGFILALALIASFGLDVPIEKATVGAWLLLLPCSPLVFRYSRTLWLHFDHLVGVHVGGESSRPLPIVDAPKVEKAIP